MGACVGVRGNRIKVIIDELAGERIDIVRYDENPAIMIPNSLQPAEVDEVILCEQIGRAIVLVRDDQLSLAIGKRGQNVRLGSRLCGWDIEITTQGKLEQRIEKATAQFCEIDGVSEELANALVGQGYLSYDDLEVIEPDRLIELGGLTEEQVDAIVSQAEVRAVQQEALDEQAKREERERRTREKAAQEAAAKAAALAAQAPALPTETQGDSDEKNSISGDNDGGSES